MFDDPAAEAAALRWVVGVAVVLVFVAFVGWWRADTRVRRGNVRRNAVARIGEADAERLLAQHGFEVVGRQVTAKWPLWIDGEEVQVHCRADLVVRPRRDRRARYVAEVKTGGAADPRLPATRRQLLEYTLVFEVDGVLLLDMEAREIRQVEFPFFERD